GLLVASAARCRRQHGHSVPAAQVCLGVQHWADDFARAPLDAQSPGQRARVQHGVPGVREQAAAGYPLLRELAVPTLR
ncbi:triphosphoribosyl-dephospho-CoA synthase, partial [Escherichia coli]|uniref:triphosphoribosyl-dephospho-CoA synthase n=2 Tax=Gammaproteobacteria TaxID=1236 RepID=UPI001EDC7BED